MDPEPVLGILVMKQEYISDSTPVHYKAPAKAISGQVRQPLVPFTAKPWLGEELSRIVGSEWYLTRQNNEDKCVIVN